MVFVSSNRITVGNSLKQFRAIPVEGSDSVIIGALWINLIYLFPLPLNEVLQLFIGDLNIIHNVMISIGFCFSKKYPCIVQLAVFQNIGLYNGKYIPHYIAGQLRVSGLISDHFYISFAKVFILFDRLPTEWVDFCFVDEEQRIKTENPIQFNITWYCIQQWSDSSRS